MYSHNHGNLIRVNFITDYARKGYKCEDTACAHQCAQLGHPKGGQCKANACYCIL